MSTYTMLARCGNCGKQSTAYIPKGTTALTWSRTAVCEFCGVKGRLTLRAPISRK
jgi:hypothetical protein